MSRKHHTKHQRSVSRYAKRLQDRGLTPSQVRMPFFCSRGHRHDTIEARVRCRGGQD